MILRNILRKNKNIMKKALLLSIGLAFFMGCSPDSETSSEIESVDLTKIINPDTARAAAECATHLLQVCVYATTMLQRICHSSATNLMRGCRSCHRLHISSACFVWAPLPCNRTAAHLQHYQTFHK